MQSLRGFSPAPCTSRQLGPCTHFPEPQLAAHRLRRSSAVNVASQDVPSTSSQAQHSSTSSRAAQSKVPVEVVFKPENKTITALPGEYFADVAHKAGVEVSLGCNQGNCGVCELELEKFSQDKEGRVVGSGSQVIRSCVARVPPGFVRLELNQMTDQIWGVDGFDT